ncbi:hypothetical protein QF021_001513 [Acidovorax delafieldii]|nr:hypothetical protein [Acidovorax delafieldii]
MSTRRHFMTQSAAAASALAFPLVGGAQAKSVKVGVLHPRDRGTGLFGPAMP